MKNKVVFVLIAAFLGTLFLFSCRGEQEKKTEINSQWKFVKNIDLNNVNPIGIVAQENFLWLSDVTNNRIVKIDLDGKIIESFDGFKRPMHMAIQKDKIYIPEYTSDSLKILEDGKVSTYKLKEKPDAIAGVSIDGNTVAVADFYNNRIILQQDNKVTIIGKEGHNDGELYYPTDVAIKNDLIYVADAYNNRVQVFDFSGKYVRMIGWNEGVKVAAGLKVTDSQVIVADFDGNRILVYNLYGKLLQTLNGKFNQPTDIEIVSNKMYVVNYKGKSLAVYQK
ncbi:NHL repeat-containing protein [Mariniflexile fucanivorans]|uniref:NHL repeat-containing protein n=1 Tax=Mariniflexile fucanivorans TaxID=264023 RepID=A0A4R1RA84_9FLAO|nr:NHL repeat-containing protein [Mariniflexile fucanivorans]TCL62651.1 NHL repeat-containing protein [Mariniflexile fucanivorans]